MALRTPERPLDVGELRAILARASGAGQRVRIRGGGSSGEPIPERPDGSRTDLDVSTRALSTELAHDPPDLVVSVSGGATWRSLESVLGARGQRLPLDPPVNDASTLGGVLASNRFGPLSLTRGRPRDWVLGLEVVRGDGVLVRSGGRVVKNVTGYDLVKLHFGAHGRLGVVVRAHLKLEPLPERSVLLAVACGSRGAALEAVRALLAEETGLASAALTPGDWGQDQLRTHGQLDGGRAILPEGALSYRVLFLGLEARRSMVARQVETARRLLRRLGFGGTPVVTESRPGSDGALCELSRVLRLTAGTVARAQAPPRRLVETLDELESAELLAGASELLVPGSDVAWLAWPEPPASGCVAEIRARLSAAGGGLVLERSTVADLDPWGLDPARLRLHAGLLRAFDPAGILGPELFVGNGDR